MGENRSSMEKLAGRVAIVTGSSRGIGKAIALDLAKEGAAVVVCGRSEKEGKLPGTIFSVAGEIQAAGGQALPVKCDVSKEDDVQQLVKQTLNKFGRVDILVNNAALAYYRSVMETPTRHVDLVMGVNFRGSVLCAQCVLPSMIANKSGSIISITSSASRDVWSGAARIGQPKRPSGALYGATKAALERFSRGLAIEVKKDGIRVNCVAPVGGVASEGVLYANPEIDASKLLSPHLYMTKAVVFLASDEARKITGRRFIDQELCQKYGLT